MLQVDSGVKGFVIDDETDEPLARCDIHVTEIGKNVTTTLSGEYWRLLAPGTYTIMAHKEGCVKKSLCKMLQKDTFLFYSYEPSKEIKIQVTNGPAIHLESIRLKRSIKTLVKPTDGNGINALTGKVNLFLIGWIHYIIFSYVV